MVSLDDLDTSNAQDLAISVDASATPVLVHHLGVLSKQVVSGRLQEGNTAIFADVLLVQLLSCGEQRGDQSFTSGVADHGGGSHRTTSGFASDRSGTTSCQDSQLQELLVLRVSQSTADFGRVRSTDIVVVHGFVDGSQEGVAHQEVVDSDDDLVSRHSRTNQLSAGSVVRSADSAEDRELGRLARSDSTLSKTTSGNSGFLEGSQDFACENLEEQSLSVTSGVRLAQTGNSSISHNINLSVS